MLSRFDKLYLGSVPVEEPCTPMNKDARAERQECSVFRRQLERMFPIPEELVCDVSFIIINNPYDGGGYKEVGVKFNTDDEAACNFAYNVESNVPQNWDERAKQELAWYAKRNEWDDKVEAGKAKPEDFPPLYCQLNPPAVLEAA